MPLFAPQEVPRLLVVGAALDNVPVQKRKQKFWLHVCKKKRNQKRLICATPKIADFRF